MDRVENGERGVPLNKPTYAPQEGKKLNQYIAALAAAIGALSIGTALSWTSPALPQLQEPNNSSEITNSTLILDKFITKSEGGWVGALLAIGALIGTFPTGFLCEYIGRKWTIIGLGVPFLLSWVLIISAKNLPTIYAARIFAGIATGGICLAVPMYIGEIAELSVRGALGSLFQFLLTIGILFTYVLGYLVSYQWLGILCGIIPCVFMIVFMFMPETPIYLLKKNRQGDAEKSLTYLRGPSFNVKQELDVLENDILESSKNKASFKDLFNSKANRNALIVGLGLMLFQQLSGVNAVIFYTEAIFIAAESGIQGDLCPIIVGVVQVIATYGSTILVERAGRKLLLLISSVVMCICLITLGSYFHMKAQDPSSVTSIGWIPLLSVNLFIITFSLGFGPLPWMMMSEIFAPSIKSSASSLAVTLNWTLTFIVTKTFEDFVSAIGIGPTFWIFSVITAIGVLFVYFKVPETKGRSFAEIQKLLEGNRI